VVHLLFISQKAISAHNWTPRWQCLTILMWVPSLARACSSIMKSQRL